MWGWGGREYNWDFRNKGEVYNTKIVRQISFLQTSFLQIDQAAALTLIL